MEIAALVISIIALGVALLSLAHKTSMAEDPSDKFTAQVGSNLSVGYPESKEAQQKPQFDTSQLQEEDSSDMNHMRTALSANRFSFDFESGSEDILWSFPGLPECLLESNDRFIVVKLPQGASFDRSELLSRSHCLQFAEWANERNSS